MAYDKKTFLSGLAMGLCGKGNPTFEGSGKMLYNGQELPKIPTVDGYGYAAMDRTATNEDKPVVSHAVLYLSTMPLERSYANNHISQIIKASASGSVIRCEYNNGDSDWTIGTSKAYNTDGTVSYYDLLITWANYDMLWSHYNPSMDGTVACHASEPVPVEDAFTKGYHVGAELRAKRVLTKWETVYERNYPATDNEPLTGSEIYNGYGEIAPPTVKSMLFVGGDIVRLTVDGASTIHTADGGTSVARIGNAWLGAYTTDTDVSDNGFDFYVQHTKIDASIIGGYITYHLDFYARNSGTYSVKIEKLVT